MKLGALQKRFTMLIAELIAHAYMEGYALTFGEAYRPKETAELYAEQGRGSKNSNHCCRLAVDFNLFRNGKYLTATEDYTRLGEFWEQLGTDEYPTAWGGRFSDGNHFSMVYRGRK